MCRVAIRGEKRHSDWFAQGTCPLESGKKYSGRMWLKAASERCKSNSANSTRNFSVFRAISEATTINLGNSKFRYPWSSWSKPESSLFLSKRGAWMGGRMTHLVGKAEGHSGEGLVAALIRQALQKGQVGVQWHHVVCVRVHQRYTWTCRTNLLVLRLPNCPRPSICASHCALTLLNPPQHLQISLAHSIPYSLAE